MTTTAPEIRSDLLDDLSSCLDELAENNAKMIAQCKTLLGTAVESLEKASEHLQNTLRVMDEPI
jgi:hypothetical protein